MLVKTLFVILVIEIAFAQDAGKNKQQTRYGPGVVGGGPGFTHSALAGQFGQGFGGGFAGRPGGVGFHGQSGGGGFHGQPGVGGFHGQPGVGGFGHQSGFGHQGFGHQSGFIGNQGFGHLAHSAGSGFLGGAGGGGVTVANVFANGVYNCALAASKIDYFTGNCKHSQRVDPQYFFGLTYVCADERKGLCPPIRGTCPGIRTRTFVPVCCQYDSQCQRPIDKCCHDTCLGHKVCKESIPLH